MHNKSFLSNNRFDGANGSHGLLLVISVAVISYKTSCVRTTNRCEPGQKSFQTKFKVSRVTINRVIILQENSAVQRPCLLSAWDAHAQCS